MDEEAISAKHSIRRIGGEWQNERAMRYCIPRRPDKVQTFRNRPHILYGLRCRLILPPILPGVSNS